MSSKFTFGWDDNPFQQKQLEENTGDTGSGESRSPSVVFKDLNDDEKGVYANAFREKYSTELDNEEEARLFAEDALANWYETQRSPRLRGSALPFDAKSGIDLFGWRIGGTQPSVSMDFHDLSDGDKQTYADAFRGIYNGSNEADARRAAEEAVRNKWNDPVEMNWQYDLGRVFGDDMQAYEALSEENKQALREAWNNGGFRELNQAWNGNGLTVNGMRNDLQEARPASDFAEQLQGADEQRAAQLEEQQRMQQELEGLQAAGALDGLDAGLRADAEDALSTLKELNANGYVANDVTMDVIRDALEALQDPAKAAAYGIPEPQEAEPQAAVPQEQPPAAEPEDDGLEDYDQAFRDWARSDLLDYSGGRAKWTDLSEETRQELLDAYNTQGEDAANAAVGAKDWSNLDLYAPEAREAQDQYNREHGGQGKNFIGHLYDFVTNLPNRGKDALAVLQSAWAGMTEKTTNIISAMSKWLSGETLSGLLGWGGKGVWNLEDTQYMQGMRAYTGEMAEQRDKMVGDMKERLTNDLMPALTALGMDEDTAKQSMDFLGEVLGGIGYNFGAMSYDLALGLMSGGVGGAAALQTAWGDVGKSAAYNAAAMGGTSLLRETAAGIQACVSNPGFIPLLLGQYGANIDQLCEQKGEGNLTQADYWYALGDSLLNSMIEIGGDDVAGGLEGLYGGKLGGDGFWLRQLKTAGQEVLEENAQNIEQRVLENVRDMLNGVEPEHALFSVDDADAILSLADMMDTSVMTFFQTAGMGLVHEGINLGMNGYRMALDKCRNGEQMTGDEIRAVMELAEVLMRQQEEGVEADTEVETVAAVPTADEGQEIFESSFDGNQAAGTETGAPGSAAVPEAYTPARDAEQVALTGGDGAARAGVPSEAQVQALEQQVEDLATNADALEAMGVDAATVADIRAQVDERRAEVRAMREQLPRTDAQEVTLNEKDSVATDAEQETVSTGEQAETAEPVRTETPAADAERVALYDTDDPESMADAVEARADALEAAGADPETVESLRAQAAERRAQSENLHPARDAEMVALGEEERQAPEQNGYEDDAAAARASLDSVESMLMTDAGRDAMDVVREILGAKSGRKPTREWRRAFDYFNPDLPLSDKIIQNIGRMLPGVMPASTRLMYGRVSWKYGKEAANAWTAREVIKNVLSQERRRGNNQEVLEDLDNIYAAVNDLFMAERDDISRSTNAGNGQNGAQQSAAVEPAEEDTLPAENDEHRLRFLGDDEEENGSEELSAKADELDARAETLEAMGAPDETVEKLHRQAEEIRQQAEAISQEADADQPEEGEDGKESPQTPDQERSAESEERQAETGGEDKDARRQTIEDDTAGETAADAEEEETAEDGKTAAEENRETAGETAADAKKRQEGEGGKENEDQPDQAGETAADVEVQEGEGDKAAGAEPGQEAQGTEADAVQPQAGEGGKANVGQPKQTGETTADIGAREGEGGKAAGAEPGQDAQGTEADADQTQAGGGAKLNSDEPPEGGQNAQQADARPRAAQQQAQQQGEETEQQRNGRAVAQRYGFKHGNSRTTNREAGVYIDSWSGAQPSTRQKAELTTLDRYAKQHGVTIVVDSTLEGGKANGSYTYQDKGGHRVVHIAQDAENPMRTVFGHELYHMIEANNQEGARVIREAFEAYAEKAGLDLDQMEREQARRYEDAGLPVPKGAALRSEIVANSLFDVIGDENTMRAIAAQSRTTVERIRAFLDRLLKEIREMLGRYADSDPGARALRDTEGAMERMRALVDKALNETEDLENSKKAVRSLGQNGEMTRNYQENAKKAGTRKRLNSLTSGLARDMVRKTQSVMVTDQKVEDLKLAALDFAVGGGVMSEVLREHGLKPWESTDAEMNRAFAILGKYMQSLMQLDAETFAEAMEPGTEEEEPAGKQYSPKKTVTPAQDAEYMQAVESGNRRVQRNMVRQAAERAGYDPGVELYHGTRRFGFTRFGTDVIWTTTSENVAAGYANHGRVRGTNTQYVEDHGDPDIIIRNAKNILGSDYEVVNQQSTKKTRERLLSEFEKANEKLQKAMENMDTLDLPDELQTRFYDITGLFQYLTDEDEHIFENQEYAKRMLQESYGALIYTDAMESYDMLRDYYNEHREEIRNSSMKDAFDALFNGYEVGDALIEYQYTYRKLALREGKFFNTATGSVATEQELKDWINQEKNEGVYRGYGNLGEKPLVIDAGKAYWLNIKAPMIGDGVYSTDYIVKWARSNGYSSVVIKNVMDPSVVNDYGDDYIFFDKGQYKSSEEVTYDDAGNVIPLSERFDEEREDIRWSVKEGQAAPELTEEEQAQKEEALSEMTRKAEELEEKLQKAEDMKYQLAEMVLEKTREVESLRGSHAAQKEVQLARTEMRAAMAQMKDYMARYFKMKDQRDSAVREMNRLRAQLGAEKKEWKAKIRQQEEGRVKHAKQMEQLGKEYNTLTRLLEHPSKNKGWVPEEYQRVAADMIRAVAEGRGIDAEKLGKKIQRALMKDDQSDEAFRFSPGFRKLFGETMDLLEEISQRKGSRSLISKASEAEINAIVRTMQGLVHEIRMADQMIGADYSQNLTTAAKETIDLMESSKRKTRGIIGLFNKIGLQHLNGRTFFEIMGRHQDNAFTAVGREAQDGQRRMEKLKMDGELKFLGLTQGENGKKYREYLRDVIETGITAVDFEGNPVGEPMKLNHDLLTALYMHWSCEENREAMRIQQSEEEEAANGVRYHIAVPDLDLMQRGKFEEALANKHRYELTEGQIEALFKEHLTDYDRQWAKAWESAEANVWRNALNETSLKLNGFEIANVEKYFTITRDQDYIVKDFDTVVTDNRIVNMGSLKERVRSSKPVMLMPMTRVIEKQNRDVSRYAGMAIAVRDATALYNTAMPGNGNSVKEAMKRNWGVDATKYYEDLIADMQGARSLPGGFMAKLRSAYASGVLSMNASVTVKQAASMVTAAGVVSWKSISRALSTTKKANIEKLKEYSAGYYIRTSQQLADMEANVNRTGFLSKGTNKLMNTIQAADLWTTRKMLWAAEYEIQDTTDLKQGTDEYWKAVAKKYEDILEITQPSSGVMQKDTFARSKSETVRSLTMFRTQISKNFNAIANSVTNYTDKRAALRANPNSAEARTELTQARVVMARTISGQVASAVILAVMTMVGKALQHKMRDYEDDKGDLTPESIAMQLLKDAGGSFASLIVGGSELYELILGAAEGKQPYDIEAAGVSTINDLYQNTYSLLTAASVIGDSSTGWDEKMRKLQPRLWKFASSLSEMLGIPLNNARNLVDGFAANAKDMLAGKPLSFEQGGLSFLGAAQAKETSNSAVAGYIAQALADGDQAEAMRLYNEQLRQGKSADSINSAIAAWQKANIPEIKEAAQAIDGGDIGRYNELINQIVAKGVSMANAVKYVEAARKKLTAKPVQEAEPTSLTYDEIVAGLTSEDTEKTYGAGYTNGMLISLMEDGDVEGAIRVRDAMLKSGKTKSGISSALSNYWKPQLQAAYEEGDMVTVRRITDMLVEMGVSRTTITGWTSKSTSSGGFGSGGFGSGGFGKKKSKKR